jgi:LysM repeat protein
MREVWQREYPETLVLGWFCSHPGYGTTVTGYDRFTHHRLFNRPWQVVFTIDPQRNISVFHRWNDDRLVEVENFTVWNARKEPAESLVSVKSCANIQVESFLRRQANPSHARVNFIDGSQQNTNQVSNEALQETAATQEIAGKSYHITLLPWLVLALMLLLLLWPSFPWSLTHLWSAAGERRLELQQLQEGIQQDSTGNNASVSPTEEQAQEGNVTNPKSITQSSQSIAETQEALVTDNRASPGHADKQLEVAQGTTANNRSLTPDSSYEIRPGDTLWAISEKTLGTPLEYQRLAADNGINNPELIHPGTKLSISSNH